MLIGSVILQKRRPPQFFSNLRETLRIMVKSFKSANLRANNSSSDHATLEAIEQLLTLHGFETGDLIHQYYIERSREQQKMTDHPYGQLTVRCNFTEQNLEVRSFCLIFMYDLIILVNILFQFID